MSGCMRFSCPSITFLFLALLCQAQAQNVAVGVKGGIRTTYDVSGFSVLSAESQRYTVGPMLELQLPGHFGVEFDALYRRFGYTSSFQSCCASAITRERSNSWEFPLIAKYRFPLPLAHPFAGVGYDPRSVRGSDVASGRYLSGFSANPPADIYTYYLNQRTNTNYPVTHGIVISGGVDLGNRHLRIS